MTPWFTVCLSAVFSLVLALLDGGQSARAQQSQTTKNASPGSILLENLMSDEGWVSPPDRPARPARRQALQQSPRQPSPGNALRSRPATDYGSDSRSSDLRSPPPSQVAGSGQRQPTSADATQQKFQSPVAQGHEDLDALLWLRTSPEFDALTRQTFAAATYQLGQALVDPSWNAQALAERDATIQTTEQLPPCVIVDVDETILDNSLYQLELIRDDGQYDPDQWNQFVDRKVSGVIEGAAEFLQACRAADVKVFFVTNRDASVETATRENLIAQNLMAVTDPDRILSKDEYPGWTSDKTSRRQAVAEKYRILLLVGDDLNDFIAAKNLTIDQRQQLYQQHQSKWGQSWFVLPNPNYGGWEQATYGYQNGATIDQKRALKRETLLAPDRR